jgi:peroxiredoxin
MVILRSLLVSLCLFSVCSAQTTPRPCADIPIKTSDGKTIRISQYRGKVVVIAMFLTTCEDCLKTLQFLSRLQKDMGPRGLQVVGISIPDDTADKITPFAQRYRFPFPVGHLEKDDVLKMADLKPIAKPTVPYIMFVDWQGAVRFQYPGDAPIFNSAEKNLSQIADGLLRQAAEKSGPKYETRPAGKQ